VASQGEEIVDCGVFAWNFGGGRAGFAAEFETMRTKTIFLTAAAAFGCSVALCAEAPKVFQGLFEPGKMVKAEVVRVVPPPEIDKYVAKVEAAAMKDPKWFEKYSKDAPPGVPLPYDEKLGLTKEEYQKYLELWGKREFLSEGQVVLILREAKPGEWMLNATGLAGMVSTLRYFPEKDEFRSPNGTMVRIEDIDAVANSILGKWTGREWRFLEKTTIGMTKENIAIGRMAGDKYGLVVYRVQEISAQGTRLYDRSIVIRFGLAAGSSAVKKGEKKGG